MSELMLAVGRDDLAAVRSISRDTLQRIAKAKILLNDSYRFRKGENQKPTNFAAATALLRIHGLQTIMLDAKLANDTAAEIKETVMSIVEHSKSRAEMSRHAKPELLTVHFSVPDEAIKQFEESTRAAGIEPACFLTSSRFTAEYYKRYQLTPADFARRQAEYLTESTSIRTVMCAAEDAEVVKEVNPALTVYATGGVLELGQQYEHLRPALVENSKSFVDVFVVGSTVLKSANPEIMLARYRDAV